MSAVVALGLSWIVAFVLMGLIAGPVLCRNINRQSARLHPIQSRRARELAKAKTH